MEASSKFWQVFKKYLDFSDPENVNAIFFKLLAVRQKRVRQEKNLKKEKKKYSY